MNVFQRSRPGDRNSVKDVGSPVFRKSWVLSILECSNNIKVCVKLVIKFSYLLLKG